MKCTKSTSNWTLHQGKEKPQKKNSFLRIWFFWEKVTSDRATIEVSLTDPDKDVIVEFWVTITFHRRYFERFSSSLFIPFKAMSSPKQSMHVQSISCWAAACIGPYSQLTQVEEAKQNQEVIVADFYLSPLGGWDTFPVWSNWSQCAHYATRSSRFSALQSARTSSERFTRKRFEFRTDLFPDLFPYKVWRFDWRGKEIFR